MDINYYNLLNYFFIYSFLGWCMECVVRSVEERTLIKDRGFVRLPFCTIYGAGALSAYYLLEPFSSNPVLLFFIGMILATAVEYATALLMTKLFGSFWWDYTKKPFNYKGILCLESSIAWGFLVIFLFKFLHPFIGEIISICPFEYGKIFISLLTVVYCIDFTTSFYKAYTAGSNEDEEMEGEFCCQITEK